MSHEHRRKNPLQNISKAIPVIHEKDNTRTS